MISFTRRVRARAPLYPRWLAATRLAIAATCLVAPALAASADVADAPLADAAPVGRPTVAAASSLRAAWPALEAAWRESLPGVGARVTFGASTTLSRQIARGAPFELFLAADEVSVERLPATRVIAGTGARYARGRLALITRVADGSRDAGGADDGGARASGPLADPLAGLARRLAAEPGLRLAIANPDHAPYGRAAREALANAGLDALPATRLVTGENAAQALQFLLAGGVDAALVPSALLAGPPPPGTRVRLIDAARHAPLVHRLVALDGASPAARALATWFTSPAARDVLAAAGFDAPP